MTKDTSRIEVGPWESLGGQSVEAWLKSRTSLAPAGVDVLSSGKVKADSKIPGMYYTTLKIKLNGKSGTGTAMACPGIDGAVRLLRLYAHNSSFGDMLSGGKYLENACKKEPKGKAGPISSAPSAPVAQTQPPRPRTSTRSSSSASMNAAALLPTPKLAGPKDVRGVIVFRIQAGGMFGLKENYIALFEDGTFTKDVVGTFSKGKAASKRKKPGYWGRWRMRGGELELKDGPKKA